MRKFLLLYLALVFALSMGGCSTKGVETDYAAAIMVDGVIYNLTVTKMPAEIDESAIIGYTEYYTDTYPTKNNETNFNRELNMPIAKVENGIAVLYENEWRYCIPEYCTLSTTQNGMNDDIILKEPPTLIVSCGESSIEALRGTTSWLYQNEDGSETAIESDSMHPLQAKEYMTPLILLPSTYSHIDPLVAYLYFEVAPDEVSVRCWSEECWEQTGAESEAVDISDYDSGTDEPMFIVSLRDGNYIYEIIAQWNSSEKYGGTAYYSFYTNKQELSQHNISNATTNQSLASFSYEEDVAAYQDGDPGVNSNEFVNVDIYPIDNQDAAVERAKNECTIEYNATNAYYDDHADMWRIVFYTVAYSEDDTWAILGNCQSVYMNSVGITQLIVYGE